MNFLHNLLRQITFKANASTGAFLLQIDSTKENGQRNLSGICNHSITGVLNQWINEV